MVEPQEQVTGPEELKRGFRKLYWSFGLKVLAGTILLAIAGFIPQNVRWLALPFVLVGAWLVLVNLFSIASLARIQHAYEHGPEDDLPLEFQARAERVLHVGSYVLLFVVMLGMVPLRRVVASIVEEGSFILLTAGSGALVAGFVLWRIKRSIPDYFRNNEARVGAVFALGLSIVICSVFGTACVDRVSAEQRAEVHRYALERTKNREKAKYIYFQKPDRPERTFRLPVRAGEGAVALGRDSLDLMVGIGDLGFVHVLGLMPPEQE